MRKDAWKNLYSFDSRWMTTSEGHRLHFVEMGKGSPVVLLHGHLTWSFYYRDLLPLLATTGHRTVAFDHLGYGLSDHPCNWGYHTQGHINNFQELVDGHLQLPPFDLVMQGWGCAIGLAYAVLHPDRVRRLVILGGSAFKNCLPKFGLLGLPLLGKFLSQTSPGALRRLREQGSKPLPPIVRDGYEAPYPTSESRCGLAAFPRELPTSPHHPAQPIYHAIETNLETIAQKPILILWGEHDKRFPMNVFQYWRQLLPNALALSFPQAGYLLLEDEATEAIPLVARFLALPQD